MSEHQTDERPAKSAVAHNGNGQGADAAASSAPDAHETYPKPKAPASVKAEPVRAGSSQLPIPSSRPPGRRSTACGRTASTSSC